MRALLDATIVVLMVAILVTLSLPVCMAVVERQAIDQALRIRPAPHSGGAVGGALAGGPLPSRSWP
jgi:CHASE2 domain-containing sensor protein